MARLCLARVCPQSCSAHKTIVLCAGSGDLPERAGFPASAESVSGVAASCCGHVPCVALGETASASARHRYAHPPPARQPDVFLEVALCTLVETPGTRAQSSISRIPSWFPEPLISTQDISKILALDSLNCSIWPSDPVVLAQDLVCASLHPTCFIAQVDLWFSNSACTVHVTLGWNLVTCAGLSSLLRKGVEEWGLCFCFPGPPG